MSDAKPILNQLNIVAKDFDATLSFHRLLGLDISPTPERDRIRHAVVNLSNRMTLEFDNQVLARAYNAA